jgi:hypothetical protein
MSRLTAAHSTHSLIESLIQPIKVCFARRPLAQNALQQARALRQLCVVHLFDFGVAIA